MKISAVICEYNPFHSGHAYHIQKTRENGATHIISLMSGNYVQRGDIAVFDKWTRAKLAVYGGADLVLELPTPYAMASAETFARGAVTLLNNLNCVDELSFGSEIGNLTMLKLIADLSETPVLSKAIRGFLDEGASFPKAVSRAYEKTMGHELSDVLNTPNNVLAVEYIKALKKIKSKIQPFTIQRIGSGHHDPIEKEGYVSASFMRDEIKGGRFDELRSYMTDRQFELLKNEIEAGRAPYLLEWMNKAILAKLRTMSDYDFQKLPDLSEGIEQRLMNFIKQCVSVEEICMSVKTKRYPLSRIRRLVISAFLGLSKKFSIQSAPYARVLAMNNKGREILSSIKSSIPILTKPADVNEMCMEAQMLFEFESHATDLYVLASPYIQRCGLEYTISPAYISD
ncbi:MAG: nucleotidyltransferase family protein [Bacillota bacterium]|nr:nucleotidyltransferase family protein [Bacillota bacterium]